LIDTEQGLVLNIRFKNVISNLEIDCGLTYLFWRAQSSVLSLVCWYY